MHLNFKNNFFGYFRFYQSVIGNKIFIFILLSIFVSFLDGLGLAMFIPLMKVATESIADPVIAKAALGKLAFIVDLINVIGFEFNVYSVLVLLVLMFVMKGVMKYYQGLYQSNLRFFFIKKIRYYLVEGISSLSYRGFLRLDAGRIQNTLIAEVQRLFMTLNHYFSAVQFGAMVVTYVFLAIYANWQFALLVSGGGLLSNLLYKRIYSLTKKASVTVSKQGNAFNSFLIQAIHNFKYLKSTSYFPVFSAKLKDVIDETENQNRKMGFYTALVNGVREPIIIIIVVAVIIIQLKVFGGEFSSIILSLLLFYRGLTVLMNVQQYWQQFIQNIGAIELVVGLTNEIQSNEEQIVESEQHVQFEQAIQLSNVVFGYNPDYTILKNISISVPKNRTIAFVGESGSGKSTVANMIAGLIAPDSGIVQLDGKNLFELNLNKYRQKIGYISQEPVIFNDTIFNNITFWSIPDEQNIAKFQKAIKLASLERFLEEQPLKDQTILGDNGVMVSGGQKQRISIARELYKNVEILILDEATSALDSETEQIIQSNIDSLQGNYTMIIIAHRLSTIKNADIIYLLSGGQVQASGSFEELLVQSADFKRITSLQEIK